MRKTIVTVTLLLCVILILYSPIAVLWKYRHLEERAKHAITGSELQTWAIQVLKDNPPGKGETKMIKTDIPTQLRSLCPQMGPYVAVYGLNDVDSSPWVRVAWSSGMLGQSGFEVGSTNFKGYLPGHEWQPGVYFFTQ